MLFIKLKYSEMALKQIGRFSRQCAQQQLTLISQEYNARQNTVELALESPLTVDLQLATQQAYQHFTENLLTVQTEPTGIAR